MAHPLFQFATLLLGASSVIAAPFTLKARQGTVSAVSTTDFDQFNPFTFFAASAYCPPDKTKDWSCGANCDANPNFQPTASGGDGSDIQFWYVGFDPDLSTIVVAHQGTDPKKIQSLLTDADFFLDNFDANLFPGISDDIKAHNGFLDEHAKTAPDILAAVQQTMKDQNTNKVTAVGHSLGGALALLDAMFLSLQIPGVDIQMINYGQPRVGNQAFADFVDANLKITRITSRKDLVPIIPGRFLGFKHESSEIHIESGDGSIVSCPGQDNTDSQCSTGDAKNLFVADVEDHFGMCFRISVIMDTAAEHRARTAGPYGSVQMDTSCPPSAS
ncbi:hypothetical protein NP233_g3846 [Leucocoprinus birnbaumii]|uniref:Fungal lipase-type domain-containing protein n=1 Tax=Leucocoprinus birnbaumii TaxID=56174 RepID=A0AAD5VYG9_9AGAR|nr:hypothetical protein NP233_g3846 [Leucocoprinus birnbaumii]